MTQNSLINKILKTSSMEDFKSRTTPTVAVDPLLTDSRDKKARIQDHWKHASVIGMLIYVASNSRKEIDITVHHYARFTHNFKQYNEKAIMCI